MTVTVWHLGILPSGVGSGVPPAIPTALALPKMRTLVANQFGRLLGEIRPNWKSLAWRLGEIDKATFSMSKTDENATEEFLHWGNRILVEFDNGLRNWGGTIETPTRWSESEIEVSCFGIEYMLQFRITGKTRAFNSAPVGQIFRQLLTETQYSQDMGLTFGPIWLGGRPHNPRYHFKSLWNIIREDLTGVEGCDVYFWPHVADGHIKFQAEMYEKLGEDKSARYAFSEGRNITPKEFITQGTIINHFSAVGAGMTWGLERNYATASERDSRMAYGLRQSSKVYPSVTIPTTLIRYAETAVDTDAYPRTRHHLPILL